VVKGTVGAPTFGGFGLEVNVTPSFIRADIGDSGIKAESIRVDPGKIQGLL
jgi:hypothetical protein